MQESANRLARSRGERNVILQSVIYFGSVAIAASLLWVALTFLASDDNDRAPDEPSLVASATPQASLVATLEDSIDAELIFPPADGVTTEEKNISTEATTRLATGDYLLTRGVIRLEFDSGATIIVEAPASISLKSADRVKLVRGRLVGNVPPVAIGFTVETASATVVDLGTEFGVAALDDQVADISVFDGEVEVIAASSAQDSSAETGRRARLRLTVDTSVRVNADGAMDVAQTQENLFFRELPTPEELQQKIAYERWLKHSQAIAVDPDIVVYYNFNDQDSGDIHLLNRAGDATSMHGDIQNAHWDAGRWPQKQSLRFGDNSGDVGSASYVQIDVPGSYDVVTTCAWVNVDATTTGMQGLLLSDGVTPDGRLHWQIREDGRLQAGFYASGKENLIGFASDVSLADAGLGQWHHVVAVCEAESSQVTYYVDGQRAGVIEGKFHNTIAIGSARIGGWKPGPTHAANSWRTLRGRIDELAVFKRVLSDAEIQAMYAAGKP
jgi:hypothetical protein